VKRQHKAQDREPLTRPAGCRAPREALRVPLARLDAAAAEALRPYGAVYVLPSGDLRSRQAAVRLRRVFGLEGVAHVADAD